MNLGKMPSQVVILNMGNLKKGRGKKKKKKKKKSFLIPWTKNYAEGWWGGINV